MNFLAFIIFSIVTFLFYKTYGKQTVAIMSLLSIAILFFTQSLETVIGATWGIVTGIFGAYMITKKK